MKDKFELKKILVGLDLSEMDEMLIRISHYIARTMHCKKVYFMHIAQSLDLPQDFAAQWGQALAPLDEHLEQNLKQQVDHFFSPLAHCEVCVEVHEGNATDRLLKLAKQKDVDLLVMGMKSGLPGSGALPEKVVRAAHRSVLLVPEILPKKMDKLLVPVDFSRHALLALEQAILIQQNSEIPLEIKCQHVYQLPTGWSSTGKSQAEFAAIMCQHARKDYAKFLKQLPEAHQNIPCVFTLDNNHDPMKEIFDQAVREQADLVLVGSKGKSAAAAALMGSVASRLALYNKSIPLLIVKDKNENISFLQALFKI